MLSGDMCTPEDTADNLTEDFATCGIIGLVAGALTANGIIALVGYMSMSEACVTYSGKLVPTEQGMS